LTIATIRIIALSMAGGNQECADWCDMSAVFGVQMKSKPTASLTYDTLEIQTFV
jgi:hypothetical protein